MVGGSPNQSSYLQTEQIRRTNRLYASDSLFSKPYLMIPVTKGSPYYPTIENQQSSSSSSGGSIPSNNNLPDNHWPHSTLFPSDSQRNSASCSDGNSSSAWDPLQSPPGPSSSSSQSMDFTQNSSRQSEPVDEELLSPEEEHKKDLDALLGKIDSTIANSRKFVVTRSRDSSDFATIEEDNDGGEDFMDGGGCGGGDYYDGAYQNAGQSRIRGSGSGHNFNVTDDTSNLITNTRQVKSSLRRLEQTQDELFEL